VTENTLKRSEKEEFLDNYFLDQLQKIMNQINNPALKNRKDQVEYILDLLLGISDEYQSVMVENEEGYWDSIEMWYDEFRQRNALKWVNESINKEKGIN